MAFKFISFILLPALVLARIEVDLSGKFTKEGETSSMNIFYTGSEENIIGDKDMKTFMMTEDNIKNGVESYFGQRPDNYYLHSPTPWGDLFHSYGWNEIVNTLVPKKGKIVSATINPIIIMQQIFENNSTKPENYDVGISKIVENTVSSSWHMEHESTIVNSISYNFDFSILNNSRSTKFSYTSTYGENEHKSQIVTIGVSSAVEMVLEPEQSVVTQLHAMKGEIKVEMEYESTLSGVVALNFEESYKGHNFWAMDVNTIMSNAHMDNMMRSKEIIEINFYTNEKITVQDKMDSYEILEVLLN